MDIHEYLQMLSDEGIDGDGEKLAIEMTEPLAIGDYRFTVSGFTGGETLVKVTDYIGQDMGSFYGDPTDTEDDLKAMANAYIAEMEDPYGKGEFGGIHN